MLDYDRVGVKPATYRFRFRTKNVTPKAAKTGFKVTMPTGYTFTVTNDYRLTCLSGCTATGAVPATLADNTNHVLIFKDIFSTVIAADTLVDLIIEGWQNPSAETLYKISYATNWFYDTDVYYDIDKFENLGTITSL